MTAILKEDQLSWFHVILVAYMVCFPKLDWESVCCRIVPI